MTRRIRLADQSGHTDTEAQGGVHRHRDPDEPRLLDALQINLLERDVQTCRRVPCSFKESYRHGDPDRLVPKFVARDQQDRTRLPQRSLFQHTPLSVNTDDSTGILVGLSSLTLNRE